jgi:hypothetical protein
VETSSDDLRFEEIGEVELGFAAPVLLDRAVRA